MYPLELHTNIEKPTSKSKSTSQTKLNVDLKECRPRITAVAIGEMRTRGIGVEQSDARLNLAVSIKYWTLNKWRASEPLDEKFQLV